MPYCASETTRKQHIWIVYSTQMHTQEVLHEINKKLYNFLPQMFEEQLNLIYITTVCLTIRYRKTSIFHITQPKLLDKMDKTYSNLIG